MGGVSQSVLFALQLLQCSRVEQLGLRVLKRVSRWRDWERSEADFGHAELNARGGNVRAVVGVHIGREIQERDRRGTETPPSRTGMGRTMGVSRSAVRGWAAVRPLDGRTDVHSPDLCRLCPDRQPLGQRCGQAIVEGPLLVKGDGRGGGREGGRGAQVAVAQPDHRPPEERVRVVEVEVACVALFERRRRAEQDGALGGRRGEEGGAQLLQVGGGFALLCVAGLVGEAARQLVDDELVDLLEDAAVDDALRRQLSRLVLWGQPQLEGRKMEMEGRR